MSFNFRNVLFPRSIFSLFYFTYKNVCKLSFFVILYYKSISKIRPPKCISVLYNDFLCCYFLYKVNESNGNFVFFITKFIFIDIILACGSSHTHSRSQKNNNNNIYREMHDAHILAHKL